MKYFSKEGDEFIILKSNPDDFMRNRIFSISKESDNFVFTEECDGWFNVSMSKEQAIEALQEAIEWIKRR